MEKQGKVEDCRGQSEPDPHPLDLPMMQPGGQFPHTPRASHLSNCPSLLHGSDAEPFSVHASKGRSARWLTLPGITLNYRGVRTGGQPSPPNPGNSSEEGLPQSLRGSPAGLISRNKFLITACARLLSRVRLFCNPMDCSLPGLLCP